MEGFWAFLAIVFIILTIHFARKAGKLNDFLSQLMREGRITPNEKFRLKSERTPPPYGPYAKMPPPPPQGTPQGMPQGMMNGFGGFPQQAQPPYPQPSLEPMPQQTATPPPAPAPVQTAQTVQNQQAVPPSMVPPQMQQQTAAPPPPPPQFQNMGTQGGFAPPPSYGAPAYSNIKPKKKAEPMSSSAVMLFVGVVLVSIAGLIFATAVWSSMSGGGRTAIMFIVSLFFFGISLFSYKKLKLADSSNAFFSLGSVFTAIAYATAGYYELFGEGFAFEGKHAAAFFGGGAVILSLLAFAGFKIYKRKYLGVISLSLAGFSYVLFSLDIADGRNSDIADNSFGVFVLLITFLFSACLFGVVRLKGKAPWVADCLRVIAGVAFVISAPMLYLSRFAQWKATDMITFIIYFAIISYYAFIGRSKPMLNVHSLYTALIVLSISRQLSTSEDEVNLYSFAAVFFSLLAAAFVYRLVTALRTGMSDNIFTFFLVITAFISTDKVSSPVNALVFICLAVYMGTIAFDYKKYSKGYGAVICLPVIAAFTVFSDQFEKKTSDVIFILLPAVLSALAAALMFLKDKLKKDTSYMRLSLSVAACLLTVFFFGTYYFEEGISMSVLLLCVDAVVLMSAVYISMQVMQILPSVSGALALSNIIISLIDKQNGVPELAASLIVFILFACLSRALFPTHIAKPVAPTKALVDPFIFGTAVPVGVLGLNFAKHYGEPIYHIMLLALCAELWAVAMLLVRKGGKRDVNTVFSVISTFPALFTAIELVRVSASFVDDKNGIPELIGSAVVFVLFIILSRVLFADSIYKKLPYTDMPDVMSAAALGAVVMLFSTSAMYPESNIYYLLRLLSWTEAAALVALLIRRGNIRSINTAAGYALCLPAAGITASVLSWVNGVADSTAGIAQILTSAVIAVCCIVLSRVVFSSSLFKKNELGEFFDPFVAAAAMMPIMMLRYGSFDPHTDPPDKVMLRAFVFTAWLEAGALFTGLVRKGNKEKTNTVFKLIASFAYMLAFIERPFLVSDEQVIEFKITLTAIVVFGFAAKYILKTNKPLADNFATVVHVLALILLIGDALSNTSLANTLVVLTTAVVIMIVSFVIKRKRWFLISSVTLVGLTVYITRDFLMSMSWWVYLLVVGVILIVIAVSNEYLKNKKTDNEKKHFFEEWKW